MHAKRLRRAPHQADARKARAIIIRQRADKMGRDGIGAIGRKQQRIAIRPRARDSAMPNRARSASAIIHNELLPESLAEALREKPRHGVGRPTCRPGIDDLHRARRPHLLRGGAADRGPQGVRRARGGARRRHDAHAARARDGRGLLRARATRRPEPRRGRVHRRGARLDPGCRSRAAGARIPVTSCPFLIVPTLPTCLPSSNGLTFAAN